VATEAIEFAAAAPPPDEDEDEEAATEAFVDVVERVDVSGICVYVGVETLFWLMRGAGNWKLTCFSFNLVKKA